MKVLLIFIVSISFYMSAYASTFYLDPVNGKITNEGTEQEPWGKLQDVIEAGHFEQNSFSPLPYVDNTSEVVFKNPGYIVSGDTLVLLGGLHGEVFLRNYINEANIHIMAKPNHIPILSKIHLQACKNWSFEGLKISTEPYGFYENNRLVYFESHDWQGPSSFITITNCDIYSAENPWTEAEDWLNSVSSGLYMKGDLMMARGNRIHNVDMGLTAFGDFITASENEIINFSGDGIRILGSNIIIENNLIKNCYKVDDNHDDGIQSFTTNGLVVDNNVVIGNTIINTDNIDRPLNGPLQGIGCFDGIYRNWIVMNNVIHVDHWHGITFLGADNVQIINNTVIDPTPDITPGASWIRIDDDKDGTPSQNCIVANNVANKFVIDALDISNVELLDYTAYENNFVDYTMYNFKLLPTSILVGQADIAYAPETDIDGNFRLFDDLADIGAYEYIEPLSSEDTERVKVKIFPNPFVDFLQIESSGSYEVNLYNATGEKIYEGTSYGLNDRLEHLISGMYFIQVKDKTGEILQAEILIKI